MKSCVQESDEASNQRRAPRLALAEVAPLPDGSDTTEETTTPDNFLDLGPSGQR